MAKPATVKAAAPKPVTATIRAYQVGFGDCFLLSIAYDDATNRHILIDFGSTGLPKDDPSVNMTRVAQDIATSCGGKLDIVVATHRHADHVSGFDTEGSAPGNIIRALEPKRVIQPWTEAPDAPEDWAGPDDPHPSMSFAARRLSLDNMHAVAKSVVARLDREDGFDRHWPLAARLRFVGEDNIKNDAAVANLMTMAGDRKNNLYVFHGSDAKLDDILPNVKVHVLGPPTLHQSASIRKYARNSNDYWFSAQQLVALSATDEVAAGTQSMLFPQLRPQDTFRKSKLPTEMRWVAERVDTAEANQMLGIVTALDGVMNNTSVILLLEAGSKKLLFPGDAQLENWSYALQSDLAPLLDDVDLYKVGHHGSLNATPKAMWNRFTKRGKAGSPTRLKSVMSTMADKHGGKKGAPTEVPRTPLVDALKAESDLSNTQDLAVGDLCKIVTIDLR
jgi:hypothetical protein